MMHRSWNAAAGAILSWGLLLALLSFAPSCTSPTDAQCLLNAECESDQCIAGVCIPVSAVDGGVDGELPDAVLDTADDGADIPNDEGGDPDADAAADDPAQDPTEDPTPDPMDDPSLDLVEDPTVDPDPDATPTGPNACGGSAILLIDGSPGLPQASCGATMSGFVACNGVDALVCAGEPPLNACGGAGVLRATPGDGCGCGGVWTCSAGGVVCAGGSERNSCGGCASLIAQPGYSCTVPGGIGGEWQCAGQDAVSCGTGNACGGTNTLAPDGARPGEACDATCGPGVWACDGAESLVCRPNLPCNSCGGGTSLAGNPTEVCGVFGDGVWACDGTDRVACEGATTPNACGGADLLTNAPGDACGVGQQYLCANGVLTCETVVEPVVRNACGGAAELEATPGTPCGVCGAGLWRCAGTNTVTCPVADAQQQNICGGCGPLFGSPNVPCGMCGDGRVQCSADRTALTCEGAIQTLNVCGGCGPLEAEVGEDCGTCGQYACSAATRRLVCTPLPAGACALTCAQVAPACATQLRSCVAGVGGADATCGACLPGYEDSGGSCISPIAAPTGVAASDGSNAAHVAVTWASVPGATGYLVYRNGTQITPSAVTATSYNDTGAQAGGTPPTVTGVAATNNRTGDVQVTWTAATPPVGATQTYTVVTVAGEQQSVPSAADTGFRAAQPITRYEVEVRSTWTAAGTGTSYTDSAAPAGTVTVGAPTATNDRTDGIQVTVLSPSTTAGASQTYRVRAVNAAGTSTTSTGANGWRSVGTPTLQWQRATTEAGSYADVVGATSATYLDTSMSAGQQRWYRVVVSAAGAVATTTAVTGGRRVRTCGDVGCAGQLRACTDASGSTDAVCGSCLPGYEEVGGTCLSPIAAPTGVAASDGTSASDVTVTWSSVPGATGYLVYRDGTQIMPTAVTATSYNDTAAPAGGAPPTVTGVAATSNRTGDVQVTWTPATPPVGAAQTYTVVAVAGAQQSVASAGDAGYRGAQPITRYEVEVRGTWTAAGTGTSYADSAAPAGTITAGAPTATTDRTDGIQASLVSPSTTAGASQTYRVRAVNAVGTSTASTSANGWRSVGSPTLQWQRATTEAGSYTNVSGATSATYLDTSMTAGQQRWYRVVVSAVGAVGATRPASGGVAGMRAEAGGGPGALGDLCTTDANCPTSAWCPTDTTERRCSPRPELASGVQMPFQYIPAGSFTMGSPEEEVGRSANEAQVSVTLSTPFFVQRTEVTQAEWRALSGGPNPSCFQSTTGTSCTSSQVNPAGPVERVTWWSTLGYANALSTSQDLAACYTLPSSDCVGTWQAGNLSCGSDVLPAVPSGNVYSCAGYRLLTEAEWEYATRAGTTTATYWGNLIETVGSCSDTHANLDGIAWWCGNSGSRSQAAGDKAPNGWGLYDVLGNVQEWTWDRYTLALPGGTDPRFESSGSNPVVRGGGWFRGAPDARSAYRAINTPVTRSNHLGFRLARTAPHDESTGCGRPPAPANGTVTAPSTLFFGVASYACDDGYTRVGNATTTCISSGEWVGPAPTCELQVAQLGEACAIDANCPPSAWCPTNASERRCSPRPEVAAGVQMPFQYIPAGSFTMGSPSGELGRSTNEAQVSVTLTRPFFVQRTEVTQAQWTALSGGTNPSCFQSTTGTSCATTNANPNGPVEQVSWWSVLGYANALSAAQGLPACYTLPASGCTGTWQAGTLSCGDVMPAVTGGNVYTCTGYRLLTEAEWEYAARAGTTTATYLGDLSGTVNTCTSPPAQANLDGIAWWCRNSGSRSQSVGGKTPNGWGLYDMLGNVRERTWDRYTATLPGGTDPRFESSGSYRVLRGGSWGSIAQNARAAYRVNSAPANQSNSVGVRLARTGP